MVFTDPARIARIDPDRWSDAMLRDIGLGDLAHGGAADHRPDPLDWRLR
jgi:hypothetical protein